VVATLKRRNVGIFKTTKKYLNNLAFVYDVNAVAVLDRRQTVGNDDDSASNGTFLQRLLDNVLRFGI
jgi:hypothetical protein